MQHDLNLKLKLNLDGVQPKRIINEGKHDRKGWINSNLKAENLKLKTTTIISLKSREIA